jgi:hypothetical protein
MVLTTHPLLVPRSGKSGAIPLPTLCAFEPVTVYLYLFIYIWANDKSYMQIKFQNYNTELRTIVGRDSSVGIATRYGLDGPGI